MTNHVHKNINSNITNAIWITWEYQVRNRNLSSILGIPLFEITISEANKARYFLSLIRTIGILIKYKPKYVFHQSPSIVLAFLIALFRPIFRYKTVIDCHNAGLKPSEGRSGLLNAIAKFSLTRAHLVIMHNKIVAKGLPKNLKKFIILPDPIPEISPVSSKEINSELRHEKKIVFICRWAEDEPYNEVIKTASNMLTKFPDITIYITGKPPKVILEQELPSNIKLTGFLDHESYNELLSGAYALVALTTRSDSLNCAGYEAIAYKKPIVLSDSETLKKFFNKGCLFTDNSSNDLESKLIDLMDNYDELVEDIATFKDDYNRNYLTMLNELVLLTP